MTDVPIETVPDDQNEMMRGLAALVGKGLSQKPKARKARQKKVKSAVDGRTLRETGRTKQFNFKCREEVKEMADQMARARDITTAEFMESLILAASREGTNQ